MDIIIDFNYLQNKEKLNVIKEIAISSINQDYIGHWIILSSHKYCELPTEVRIVNEDLIRSHGIEWSEGNITFKNFKEILDSILINVRRIYVYDKVKMNLLKRICNHKNIIDLKQFECPWKWTIPTNVLLCYYHGFNLKDVYSSCALTNVINFKNYIIKNREKFDIEINDKGKVVTIMVF